MLNFCVCYLRLLSLLTKSPCRKFSKFCLFSRGFTTVVHEKICFAYTDDQYIWHKNNFTKNLFYIRDSWAMLKFWQYTQRCQFYSQIFQQQVGLTHVHWKSLNIRASLSQLEILGRFSLIWFPLQNYFKVSLNCQYIKLYLPAYQRN